MIAFLVGKALRSLGALLIVVTLVFVALRLAGDPAMAMLPPDTPPEAARSYLERWSLDRPIVTQYLAYLGDLWRGDFGVSFRNGLPVAELILARIPATLQLMGATLAVMSVVGLGAGIAAGLGRGRPFDRAIMVLAVAGYSLPNFFLGVLLILIFAVHLHLLPTSGSTTWRHTVLPAVTMGFSWAGVLARFARSSVLDALHQPFVTAARARGLSAPRVVSRHVLPNAAIPVVTVIGLIVGGMIGGAIVTEAVFAWPGIGRLLVISVERRDLPVVQAIVLMIAATMVAANLIVDLLYRWLDPRVRLRVTAP